MDDENPLEAKEQLEELGERRQGWAAYLAITTALIAVAAAIASLLSGNYANSAILAKNEAVLAQSKASDQYNYYQAKGIKKTLDDIAFAQTGDPSYASESTRYAAEQVQIKKAADDFVAQVAVSNKQADHQLEKHHSTALAVTLLQIGIALSAMSALLRRRSFWVLSLTMGLLGSVYLISGVMK